MKEENIKALNEENKINILLIRAMKKAGVEIPKASKMTEEEYTKWKCDTYNAGEGNLHETDGYNCPECKNKGNISYPKYEEQFGYWNEVQRECKCQEIRRTIRKLEKSGLKNIIKDYTFQKYEAMEEWQQMLKNKAIEYVKKNEKAWFFMCGQPGAGKTHLCTAIAGYHLKQGHSVKYMVWRDDIVKIKSMINDVEYERIIDEYKQAKVLYIDDLFKPSKDANNNNQRPTGADIQIAFEILNYRYNNKDLITIISSERSTNELIDIDEATASRIIEMSFQKGYGIDIAKDQKKNYRLKGISSI